MKMLLRQKIETIGNKRRTTTITTNGITVKEVVLEKQVKDIKIPGFILRWQEQKKQGGLYYEQTRSNN
jgi:hypothetical protein